MASSRNSNTTTPVNKTRSKKMWTYDPAQREYYYYSSEEKAYVYETGLRVWANRVDPADIVIVEPEEREHSGQSYSQNSQGVHVKVLGRGQNQGETSDPATDQKRLMENKWAPKENVSYRSTLQNLYRYLC
jgi:hypothetical protein